MDGMSQTATRPDLSPATTSKLRPLQLYFSDLSTSFRAVVDSTHRLAVSELMTSELRGEAGWCGGRLTSGRRNDGSGCITQCTWGLAQLGAMIGIQRGAEGRIVARPFQTGA